MKLTESDFLKEVFAPKEGYKFNQAIFTTFTLNTAVLPTLLLHTYCAREGKTVPTNTDKSLLALANAGTEAAERLTIFADGRHNALTPPSGKSAKIQQYINNVCVPGCVVRVDTGNDGMYFHPKLILADFLDDDGRHYIRGAVMSKNLTFETNVLEIGCLFETDEAPTDERVELKNAGPEIADFFKNVASALNSKKWSGKSLSMEDAYARIQGTLDAMKGQKFFLLLDKGTPIPASAQLLLGTPSDHGLFDKYNQKFPDGHTLQSDLASAAYWCSDSISKPFMDSYHANRSAGEWFMISNLHSLANCLAEIVTKDPLTNAEISTAITEIGKTATCCMTISGESPYFVHAKFSETFYPDNTCVVLLGSANYTENAFTNNYECDVRLFYDAMPKPAQPIGVEKTGLAPLPFLAQRPASMTIKTLAQFSDKDALIESHVDAEFDKALQSLTWTLSTRKEQDGAETLCVSAVATDTVSLVDILMKIPGSTANERKNYETQLTQMQIDLNGKVLPLAFSGNIKGEIFHAETTYRQRLLPPFGTANVIFFGDQKDPRYIPVPITISGDMQPQQGDMTPDQIINTLLGGRKISLIDLIPSEPNSRYELYDPQDSVEIRLAKYLALGGKAGTVLSNLQKVLKAADMLDDDAADDEDMPDLRDVGKILFTDKDRADYKKLLENFREFLNTINTIRKEST